MNSENKTEQQQYIELRGARVNNLKNISIDLPRGKFIVITGVSGSGKSSLAFDTLFAEGQRRYVESLSTYARQFLGKMAKPECNSLKGLPPAIAIEQKVNTRNPRSTVGTATEIYDYMRLMFARAGHTYSPVSGAEVRHQTAEDVVNEILKYPEGTRIAISSPIIPQKDRTPSMQLNVMLKAGYSRLMKGDEFVDIAELIELTPDLKSLDEYSLLIDRLSVSKDHDEVSRMTDSAETAFFEGHGSAILTVWVNDGNSDYPTVQQSTFSNRFESDGICFEEPDPQMFNFNNPYGACPVCEGFGKTLGIDPMKVVPNQALSIYDDAVVCWRGEKMGEWKRLCIHHATDAGFPIHRPYNKLTDKELDFLWHGNSDGSFPGIDGFFRMVDENQYKIQYRVMKARYRGKTICPECHGHRLRKEAEYVRIAGKSITDLTNMPVSVLQGWFKSLPEHISASDAKISERLIAEITTRLDFLCDVGLGYLTLNRPAATLSGGESQRINLATSLGSALVGSLYILDEPSIGLHSRDTERLIGVLRQLQQKGNTVVVVEHDGDIMRASDFIVDIGPDAGRLGGEVILADYTDRLLSNKVKVTDSHTLKFLNGQMSIPHSRQRKWSNYIEIQGACEHNLKNVTVRFPLGVLTVVTGVSGSGKSTLVRDILYRSLSRKLNQDSTADTPGAHIALAGDTHLLSSVEMVDQNPIGRSTRSNPATYLKAYDEIRQLYSIQPLARQMGFTPAYFSFNTEGGRCEQCKGEGVIQVEMQFMADITVPCESCHGHRFKRDVLDVLYNGKNIYDILEMTVDEAINFFSSDAGADNSVRSILDKIVARLRPLAEIGLGYIKLGQSSATLSGGENQRVKLASFIAGERRKPTMFIFDEPTTGLHFHDIDTLMRSLQRLVDDGHTVVIIEHNTDVIAAADHIIDLGPEGGDEGGNIIVEGTPQHVAECKKSYTGQYLKKSATLK